MPQLHIDDTKHSGLAITFEQQPIVASAGQSVVGYELLYRGLRPAHWPVVDQVVLRYLKAYSGVRPTFFVNLSNETVLTEDLASYLSPAYRANTVFELTETITDAIEYRDVANRINSFTKQGIRFAIDDFGSGLDGLHRYAALDELAYVKLDRDFLRQAAASSKTGHIVELLVREWERTNTLTIAEGIETPFDLRFATNLGVQMLQGYLIDDLHQGHSARPGPVQAGSCSRGRLAVVASIK